MPRQAKRHMLENIQRNMASLKVNGALSSRLPEIAGPVFEVNGYRSGGQDTQCFVSLSADDPDRYSVALRRPARWSHPDRSAPRDCRRLHLHERDAPINPRP